MLHSEFSFPSSFTYQEQIISWQCYQFFCLYSHSQRFCTASVKTSAWSLVQKGGFLPCKWQVPLSMCHRSTLSLAGDFGNMLDLRTISLAPLSFNLWSVVWQCKYFVLSMMMDMVCFPQPWHGLCISQSYSLYDQTCIFAYRLHIICIIERYLTRPIRGTIYSTTHKRSYRMS